MKRSQTPRSLALPSGQTFLFLYLPLWLATVVGSPGAAFAAPMPGSGPQLTAEQRKEIEKTLEVSEFLKAEAGGDVKSVEAALKECRDQIAANPDSAGAAAAQFRVGVLNEKVVKGPSGERGDRTGALNAYEAVVKKYGKSPFAAVALYRKAEVLSHDQTPDGQKAFVKAYEAVNTRFPKHLLPNEQKDGTIDWQETHLLVGKKLDEIYSGKPSYQVLNALVAFSSRISKNGACGLAIIFLTIVVKLLITPLTRKQFQSMKDMQKVQPEVKKLQEKLKGNPQKLNQEVMALYKRHGVNPLGGCFPLLIQMPILIWLYRAIMQFKYQFEGEGFLWVSNLADPDMPLLGLYLVSMIVSQKLTTIPTADPQQQQTQKMMMYMMPIMFAFMFKTFPAAFILYWLMFNILSTGQQYFIMRDQTASTDKKLGIKTLIPAKLMGPAKPAESPVIQAPKELTTTASSSRKRRKKGRK